MPVRWLVLVAALAGTVACALGQPRPSEVAQGRYFSTGNPDYDEFFVRLHHMQLELRSAPEALTAAKSELLQRLELPPTADTAALRAALGTRASDVGGRGAHLAVDRDRDAGASARLSVSGTPAEADRPFVTTLDSALTRLADLRDRFAAWQKELDWLPGAGIALDGSVEAAFIARSRSERNDVHQNLADAQRVVALMAIRMKEVDRASAELETAITGALGSTQPEPPPAPPTSATPTKATPRAAPPGAETRSSKPSAPGEDEPAAKPKPKQGTARPDFEP